MIRAHALTFADESLAVHDDSPPSPASVLRTLILDEKGLSQADVAHVLGISSARLSMLLNGRRPMSPEIALRLARVFDISAEFWLDVRTDFDLHSEGKRWSDELQCLRPLAA